MSSAARRRSAVGLVFLSSPGLLSALPGPPAATAIYRWDNGELITEEDAGTNASLYEMDLADADFSETTLLNLSSRSSCETRASVYPIPNPNALAGISSTLGSSSSNLFWYFLSPVTRNSSTVPASC